MRQEAPDPAFPGWKPLAVAALLYVACVSLATWPRVLWFRSTLPSLGDPLQHLWIMRWYQACVCEGRSFVLCPEVQYPTGAPLGCFSPLYLQAMLFVPLSLAIDNDILCYNLVWMIGMVSTGLGAFLLIARGVRNRWCAGFGGLLAMLSGPMMLHAMAHLELIFLGAFPMFLAAWIAFVDRPGRGRLAASVGLYLLLATCAAYYAVLAVFPALLYASWSLAAAARRREWGWLKDRLGWFAAFGAIALPGLALIFGNQLWVVAHGYAVPRTLREFRTLGAPLWGYAVPTWLHALGRRLASSPYDDPAVALKADECASYLGVVALGLIAYAALRRVKFARGSFWWLTLVVLVVLSGGAAWSFGRFQVPLPAIWLKKNLFLFRMIRAPARFNLFAAVVAALIASHGLEHLLGRLPGLRSRGLVFAALSAMVVADLAIVPGHIMTIPPMPGCYAFMERAAPGTPFVEAPQFGSGGSHLYSICAYWQSHHRGRTSAGYCGQGNMAFDNLLTYESPFSAERLARPDYLDDPEHVAFDLVGDVRFLDDAWLYLSAHGFRFLVLHQWPHAVPELPARLDRLKAALEVAKVYDDGASVVYDRDRLPRPNRPVVLITRGWLPAWDGKFLRAATRSARLAVYQPEPAAEVRFRLDIKALRASRRVRLLAGGIELVRWDVRPDSYQSLESPAFRLPPGLHELTLESDGDARPKSWAEAALLNDPTPYSARVGSIAIAPAPSLARRPGAGRPKRPPAHQ